MHGTTRHSAPHPRAELPKSIATHHVDLRDRQRVAELVRSLQPAWVFHLAALSSPAASWDDPGGTIATNAEMEGNLLSSLIGLDGRPRVLIVGSGDEYGHPPGRARRLSEDAPLRPITPYGVSKVAQDLLGLQYFLSHGLPVIRVRPFNHAGPRQSPDFAIASFAQQIARIEQGSQPPALKVGNLQSRRDFTDVRDIARAYLLAIEKGKPGDVYNIGSGKAPRLREILDLLLKQTRVKVRLEVDAARKPAAESPVYLCDARRFQRLTGWRPQISLARMLGDTLAYWRKIERSSG